MPEKDTPAPAVETRRTRRKRTIIEEPPPRITRSRAVSVSAPPTIVEEPPRITRSRAVSVAPPPPRITRSRAASVSAPPTIVEPIIPTEQIQSRSATAVEPPPSPRRGRKKVIIDSVAQNIEITPAVLPRRRGRKKIIIEPAPEPTPAPVRRRRGKKIIIDEITQPPVAQPPSARARRTRRTAVATDIDDLFLTLPDIKPPTLPPPEETPAAAAAPPQPPTIPEPSPTPVREAATITPKQRIEIKEKIAEAPPKTELEAERREYDAEARAAETPEDFLYPHMNDPDFAKKISLKKEFADFMYDGEIRDIKSYAEVLCNAPFELAPHQNFVKNFLSSQTPYSSLLLYHGLGTGKTCSAIGITEEMRAFMKQTGMTQKIIIVASPNVQGNFQKELFNDARLTEKDGIWSLNTCIGNKLLKEINPTNIRNIPRDKIISQIKTLINNYYQFMGYIEFAKFIQKRLNLTGEFSEKEKNKYEIQQLRRFFNNRFIVIDEVHNITMEKDISERASAKGSSLSFYLLKMARYCENLRFLLLSATPMYNKYTEIIWLANLMNLNDKRPPIKLKDVFTQSGDFVVARGGGGAAAAEDGRELLMRKIIGYVSYVRGENPYTFPFRLYPDDFGAKDKTYVGGGALTYPKIQLNGADIPDPLKHIKVYSTEIGDYQERGYMKIIRAVRGDVDAEMDDKENFGYSKLIAPLEALNMVYPVDESTAGDEDFFEDVDEDAGATVAAATAPIITGKRGLRKINKFEGMRVAEGNYVFDYKPDVLKKYGRIFSQQHIGHYSHKIADICENIRRGAEGIILIYSFHIDGGLVPMALALEEMGFTRFSTAPNTKSLFEKPPAPQIDATTLRPAGDPSAASAATFSPAKYVMITGDKRFSQSNTEDLKHIVSAENRAGEKVKVVLISLSGSEGLDFKCVRQIHILDSWYNMSRIEQIIGRGVRNLSHCALPFEKRNVEIYLHTTHLVEAPEEEAVDLYLYRFAEKKAIQIGKVARVLKQAAADCILNVGQTNFTVEKLNEVAANKKVEIETSSAPGRRIMFSAGDKPYTSICDYMESCTYGCEPATAAEEAQPPDQRTYDEYFMERNRDLIMKRIRQLYREHSTYRRADLIAQINSVKKYPIDQIFSALDAFINNENEYLIDSMGRYGTLINRADIYLFQPGEFNDTNATIYERSVPVEAKRESIFLQIPDKIEDGAGAATAAVAEAAAPDNWYNIFEENMEFFGGKKKAAPDRVWYSQARQAADAVAVHGITLDAVQKYVIEHMVDVYPRKLELLKWAASNPPRDTPLKSAIYDYIETRHIYAPATNMSPEMEGYLMDDGAQYVIYILRRRGDEGEPEFEVAVQQEIKLFYGSLRPFVYELNQFNNVVGFISPPAEKEMMKNPNKEYGFKVKNMEQVRGNIGVFCGSSGGKTPIINYINKILGKNLYTEENTIGIFKPVFCCMLEFLLRHYQKTNHKNKVWFFTPERAALNMVAAR
jgi:hypothetical protein